jgi:serine/threonine protein kinase
MQATNSDQGAKATQRPGLPEPTRNSWPLPAVDLELGLGHTYRLGESLGQSSCGAVWLATWVQTGEPVAVKTLRVDVQSPHDRAAHSQALLREARQLRQLRHRHVVRFQHSGMHQGEPVLVLEELHESLHQHLQRLPRVADAGMPPHLVPALALRWAHQVALGLGSLHQAGLRHLDLKPANLLLTPPGPWPQRVKIADFGACLGADVGEHPFFGTPGWVAPEQLRSVARGADGQPLFATDARTDVFALGQLLFAMLTGRKTEFSVRSQVALEGGEGSQAWQELLHQADTGALTERDIGLLHDTLSGRSSEAGLKVAPELLDDQPTWLADSNAAGGPFRLPVTSPGVAAGSPTPMRDQGMCGLLQSLCQPAVDNRPVCGATAGRMLAKAIAAA